MTTTATMQQLHQAMEILNKRYPSVAFENIQQVNSKRVRFTLKAKTGEPGSKRSWTGRRLPKASWHAHGYFFEALFEVAPDAVISSWGMTITAAGGNWQDYNIGSIMNPMYASECSIL